MYTQKAFLLVICILISKSICEDYSVTPITTSSGLYYEKIGEVLLSNSNWQFVTSVDYKGYLLFYEYLQQQASQIHSFCETVNSTICRQGYSRIQPNLDRIEQTDESMANFLGVTTKPRRVKRFWSEIGSFLLKIGGTIGRAIFGGGSSNVDLSSYNRAISDLYSGQKELQNQLFLQRTVFMIDSEKKNVQIQQLNKNQVDIQNKIVSLENSFEMDKIQKEKEIKELKEKLSEIDDRLKKQEENQKMLNGRVDKIEKNLLDVDKSITEIKQNVENNAKKIDRLEIISQVNVLCNNFILLMIQFEREQQILFEVVRNANRGHLDPYILTPSKLIEMLVDIQAHLPEGTKFPYYPNIENAQQLYNIIKPSVYLFDYKIIFILKISLVYSKTFSFHKITSMPAAIGDNKFIFILPKEPFMIIDRNYEDYMLMSMDNFRTFCSPLEKTKHLCQQIEEIFDSQSSEDCEVNLFKSPRKIPEMCNTRVMVLDKPMFLQLQRERSWIYITPTAENVIVTCSKNRSTVSFKDTGFIHINDECFIQTHNFKLSSLHTFTNPVESSFFAPLNLSDSIDFTEVDDIEMKSVKNIQTIFPFDFKKLEDLSYRIEVSKTNLIPLYCVLFLVLIILCVFIYLVYKKKIDLSKLCNIRNLTNRMMNAPSASTVEDGVDSEKIKMKIKVENPDDIQDVSIYGTSSETDPDSEYLTVKFKVKKDPNAPSVSNKNNVRRKINNQQNNLPPKVNKEDEYLNDLRKLKPKVIYNKV